MIDTHCHLDEYENIDEIVSSFDGIIITSGYDDKSNLKALEIVDKYKNVYGTLGIHPEEASNNYNLKIIEENIDNPKIVAIGEIGLDYHYTKDNMEKQKQLFMRQLDLANKYQKPIVVHSRDAILDTYNILSNYHLTGSIHCFASSLEMALKFIYLGYNTIYNGESFSIRHIIKSILNFDIGYSWYIKMYLGLFLLIPFINLIYNNLKNKKQKQVLILTMLVLTSFQGIFNIKYNLIPDWWISIYPLTYYFIGCYK